MKKYETVGALATLIGALVLSGSQASASTVSTFTDVVSNGMWQIGGDDPAFTGSLTISTTPSDTISQANITVDGIPVGGGNHINVSFTTISGQQNRGSSGYQIDLTSGSYSLVLDIASRSNLFGGSSTTFTDGTLSLNGNQVGDNFTGNLSVSPTPRPATLPLFASGLGALGLLGWRRKRTARSVAV